MISKSTLSHYYRQIQGQLICSKEEKRKTIAYLKEVIAAYLEDNPQADMARIQAQFGTPESIAADSTKTMDNKTLSRKLRVKKRIFLCVAAVAFTALLLWTIGIVVDRVIYYEILDGFGIISIS